MTAYHGDAAIKAKYLARVRAHQAADELVQGYGYWKDGKGCAVGCTIHGDDHRQCETALGIPRAIARLEDGLFERMDVAPARTWPERFLEAVPVGASLENVVDEFLLWLLVDEQDGVLQYAKTEQTKAAIKDGVALFGRKLRGEKIAESEWRKVRNAAFSASSSAYASASAYAAYAVAYAAYGAAYGADASAAAAAATAAIAAAASSSAWNKKRAEHAVKSSEKLLELLRNAPVQTCGRTEPATEN